MLVTRENISSSLIYFTENHIYWIMVRAETVFFLPPGPSPPPFPLVFVLQLFFSFRFCCLSFFCILDLPYRLRFLFPHIFLFDWIEWIENLAKDERETGPSDHKAENGGNLKTAGYFYSPL